MKQFLLFTLLLFVGLSTFAQSIYPIEADIIRMKKRVSGNTLVDVIGGLQTTLPIRPGSDTVSSKYGLAIVANDTYIGNGSFFVKLQKYQVYFPTEFSDTTNRNTGLKTIFRATQDSTTLAAATNTKPSYGDVRQVVSDSVRGKVNISDTASMLLPYRNQINTVANSTISGIPLNGNLANLTATNTTLTLSGAYNGSTARTIGLNLGNANTWTALQTFANKIQTIGNITKSSWGANGANFETTAAIYTDNSTIAGGNVVFNAVNSFGIPVLAANNTGVTNTIAANVYIAGAPVSGANVFNTNPYALYVASGLSSFVDGLRTGGINFGNGNGNSFIGGVLSVGFNSSGIGGISITKQNTGDRTTLTFANTFSGGTIFNMFLGGPGTGTIANSFVINNGALGNNPLVMLSPSGNLTLTGKLLINQASDAGFTGADINGTTRIQGLLTLTTGLSADLTATNSTLTFSGSYNGSTARTIGLNLGNANTWTASQTFSNTITTTGNNSFNITPSYTLSGTMANSDLFINRTTTGSTTGGQFLINGNTNGINQFYVNSTGQAFFANNQPGFSVGNAAISTNGGLFANAYSTFNNGIRINNGFNNSGSVTNLFLNSSISSAVSIGFTSCFIGTSSTATSGTTPYVNMLHVGVPSLSSGQTITNLNGVLIPATITSGSPTVTNTSWLNIGGIVQNVGNWSIYNSGTYNNYFASKLLIGTTIDAGFTGADINGTVRIQGVTTLANALTTTQNTFFIVNPNAGNDISFGQSTISTYFNIRNTGATLNVGGYSSLTSTSGGSTGLATYLHRNTYSGTQTAGNLIGFQSNPTGTLTISGSANYYSFSNTGTITPTNSGTGIVSSFNGVFNTGLGIWNLYMSGTASNYLAGKLLIGTTTDAGFTGADINGTVRIQNTLTATKYQLPALNTPPASSIDIGTTGEIRWSNGFVYLCVATNTWQRAALSTF